MTKECIVIPALGGNPVLVNEDFKHPCRLDPINPYKEDRKSKKSSCAKMILHQITSIVKFVFYY